MEVAVYGYGNIGSGVVEVIERNQDVVSKGAGCDMESLPEAGASG